MALRKRIKNSNRGGIPISVSPYPEKLPYGPIPYSFTFDFSQDPPADLSDYINNIHSTTRGRSVSIGSNLTEEYNQTVSGRDECVVYTVDANFASGPDYIKLEFTFDPDFIPGDNTYGRISSKIPALPITDSYTSGGVSFEYYISGYNTGTVRTIHPKGFAAPTSYFDSGLATIVEDAWTSVTLINSSLSSDGRSLEIRFGNTTADPAFFGEEGGFVAFRNVTFFLTP